MRLFKCVRVVCQWCKEKEDMEEGAKKGRKRWNTNRLMVLVRCSIYVMCIDVRCYESLAGPDPERLNGQRGTRCGSFCGERSRSNIVGIIDETETNNLPLPFLLLASLSLFVVRCSLSPL